MDGLGSRFSDWEERLKTKRFTKGRHNDARFVRWSIDDGRFTNQVMSVLKQHLEKTFQQADQAILVTHHPCFSGLSFPRLPVVRTLDSLLWDAYAGNRMLEQIVAEFDRKIPFAFCGHTHRARENRLGRTAGYNIGGDYHFKRLLVLEWPQRVVRSHVFGDARVPVG
jgi:hypothetical protein